MKYRYLDLRRNPVRENMILRSKVAIETRKYLAEQDFIEVETPVLIKSTPKGARDFVVPSRMNERRISPVPSISSNLQTTFDGFWFRQILSNCKMLRDEDSSRRSST